MGNAFRYTVLGVIGLVAAFIVIGAFGFLTSIKGVDSGKVCLVKEGGPFDGRSITKVRQPGSAPGPIGAWNKHLCLPVTERDSNDVIAADEKYATRDSIQVIADGQALYQLTTDQDKIESFYLKNGLRKWNGEDITSDEGFLEFQRTRIAPVLTDSIREVIGSYECTSLNNLCQYVQNPNAAADAGEVEQVDNTQNLAEANQKLGETIQAKLDAAFGEGTFENVRYQNLRIRFEEGVQQKIDEAQALRTAAANAKLEAARDKAQAQGEADVRIARAQGEKEAAIAQAKAYKANPVQADIDRINAFCGVVTQANGEGTPTETSKGCNPQIMGSSLKTIIANLGSR